ncbi:MAG TPA: alpha-L-arabinofuranosidase C-terminal domain-containing protein [Bryobacteraceae bacterium]|nr:alpha-L-arabinofuranosidase C-terminal domain-containing protein [Bryobacteraceae bacterium]
MPDTRRAFLRTAVAAACLPALRAASPDARVDVLLDEPIGTIDPGVYSHFVENLGGVVYDGIWVGERSHIPNVNGIRKQLVDGLARLKPGAIRWPGGCFADQYDWRDGTGPRAQRPRRTNFWVDAAEWPKDANPTGPQRYDPNEFGTIDFARFCKLSGAQPYFAANVRSLPAQEFWRWAEYCNSPAHSTTLSDLRAADGEPAPLGVRFWGVGNESWGCGGNFDPEDYATEFGRYTAWVPSYGARLEFVASGPNGDSFDWTRRFCVKAAKLGVLGRVWGLGLHHYAWNASGGRTNDWTAAKGDALKFDAEQYYEILREADRMDSLITTHWKIMGESDPRHRTKLVVDEWGGWYAPGTEPFAEALIGQQSTMRDAVLAGLTLDTFNRHADKVAMANVAQLVNCLQSLFLAHEDRFCLTPTYHVFDLFMPHRGGRSLRTVVSASENHYARNGGSASMRGLSASASVTGEHLTVTLTNPSFTDPREVEIAIHDAPIRGAFALTLSAGDPHAHNSFENPNAVEPKQGNPIVTRGIVSTELPPASVTRLTVLVGA